VGDFKSALRRASASIWRNRSMIGAPHLFALARQHPFHLLVARPAHKLDLFSAYQTDRKI